MYLNKYYLYKHNDEIQFKVHFWINTKMNYGRFQFICPFEFDSRLHRIQIHGLLIVTVNCAIFRWLHKHVLARIALSPGEPSTHFCFKEYSQIPQNFRHIYPDKLELKSSAIYYKMPSDKTFHENFHKNSATIFPTLVHPLQTNKDSTLFRKIFFEKNKPPVKAYN